MPVNINASNSAGIQITADTSGVIQFQSNGANTVQIAANGTLLPLAGTTTAPPLDFVAGTNLTTPIAGAMEYDGTTFFGTPIGTQRGIISASQYFRLNSGLAGANVNTAQNILGVGVTLSSNTVYEFIGAYIMTKTAGSTSHTVGLGYGGTATANNFLVMGIAFSQAGVSTVTHLSDLLVAISSSSLANQTISPTPIANVASYVYATVRGTISVNAGGTFIPQYTLSAAPGGAYTTAAGSYFMIRPVGAAGANVSVGTWA